MKFETIGNSIKLLGNKALLTSKKYAPEIMIVAGVVGFVATTVIAVKTAKKTTEEIAEADDFIKEIRESKDCPDVYESESEYRKSLTAAYVKKTVVVAKTWSPVVITGVASTALILAGAGIIRKRYTAVVAAYNAIDMSFKNYRNKVIDELGKDADLYFKNGVKKEDIKFKRINEDTGEVETVEEKDASVVTEKDILDSYSQYAKFFDESSPYWKNNCEMNLLFLNGLQCQFNNELKIRGHVFLNEVYDALGIPRTKEGAVVGWRISKDKNSDNYIDFGIYDLLKEKNRDFVNGYEPVILLDFNVDGVIYDKI